MYLSEKIKDPNTFVALASNLHIWGIVDLQILSSEQFYCIDHWFCTGRFGSGGSGAGL